MTAMVLSNDGITAINNAGSGGPRVDVTQFKVGADAAFTPLATDTDIHGTLHHTGTVTNYTVLPDDIVEWELLMDQTVGDFAYGNIGLFLASGDLFALAAFPTTRNKVVQNLSGGEIGNRVIIRAQASITDPALTLNFTNIVDPNREQWADDARTATHINSTQFTISGDVTADFTVDRAIKASLGGPFVYGYIDASSFGGGVTTITISEAVLTASLTAVDFGILQPGDTNASARTARAYKATGTEGLTAESAVPLVTWVETDAAANNKHIRALQTAEQFFIRTYDDAFNNFDNIIRVDRTAHVIDDILFESGNVTMGTTTPGSEKLNVTGSVAATISVLINGNAAWHAGNDGAASGLDADLLDGVQGSGYSLSAHIHAVATGGSDGFMSAADKTKLDTVESSAKDDQTASEILALLVTVDGTGSGLDADLVDGLHAAAFVRSESDDSVNGNTQWQDNKHVRLGTSADMKMYHDGVNNIFDIAAGQILRIQEAGPTTIAEFSDLAGCVFSFNGTVRLKTNSTGAETVGTHLAVDYDTTSSKTFKRNIEPYSAFKGSGLFDPIKNPVVSFRFNDSLGYGTESHIGLIAENVEKVDHRLVSYDADGKPRAIKTNQIQAVIIAKIQEMEGRLSEANI